ncbi:hypothetical protein DFA_10953 [Cavenderia fasciculata]|uniref:phytol kinase n=1 Tax=Cavenderia fasciculata TaxID=261658 RepID=F4QBV7_CACFS|nr:uncharacterized protein DFA_10953 [Cavenderia fasciculata]EGG14695.1 hypothetical protein DFA_10953 [Cavenderia fasciculata]|eukprot:XP_004351203.1 hypothetical protein DFA_10953 [Cavenderia fasciculata]
MNHNIIPTAKVGLLCLSWLLFTQFLSSNKVVSPARCRKLVHIGTGIIYVMSWGLYPINDPSSRLYCSIIPALVTFQFTLVGMGLLKDKKVVDSMSRSGNPRELLFGPATYGIIFVLSTIIYWANSPVGITALSLLCFGDGFAGLIGSEFGRARIPYNRSKTIVGSVSFVIFSVVGSLMLLTIIQSYGYLIHFSLYAFIPSLIVVSIIGAIVESLPIEDWDNITVFMCCVLVLGWSNYDLLII